MSKIMEKEIALKTKITVSVEGDRTYAITKTVEGMEGGRGIFVLLYPTRNIENLHVCSEVEGFSELSIIGTGGHSSIQSTKRYQHATMQRMKADMEKLEVAFQNVAVSQ